MKSIRFITLVLFALLFSGVYFCGLALAEDAAQKRSIRAMGRSKSVVTTNQIYFGDLASLESRHLKDDEAIIALKKIVIEASPTPGEQMTISAARVLERLREEGVNLDEIGYALPKIMSVSRASRMVTKSEMLDAIRRALKQTGRDIEVKDIAYKNDFHIVPGEASFEAIPVGASDGGRMSFQIMAHVRGKKSTRYEVQAIADEWVEVPVASRPLGRGALVSSNDVMMARLNISSLPGDAAFKTDTILGYETKQGIRYGEVFRKNKLAIPPLIESGARVTMIYETPLLKATASGVALQDGIEGQEIRIRNESSRRVVVGTVLESGDVGVSQ